MKSVLSKTGIIGIVVLIIGLLAGVFLVQQSQEFREKAGDGDQQMVVICHRLDNGETLWEEIEVSEGELENYMDQGSLIGTCPPNFKIRSQDGDSAENSNDTQGGSDETVKLSADMNSSGRISNNDLIQTQVTPTPTPTLKPTTPVMVVKNDATFRFFMKFQGINAKKPARLIEVSFNRSGSETHTYKNVRVSPNSEGVYFGQLENIPSGVFDISFKTESHLKETFKDIKIDPGINTWYFENNPLLAGDFNSDNILDVTDVALLLSEMNGDPMHVDSDNEKYDVDVNARIDMSDLELVLSNMTSVETEGE
ncbi:hypothetical protein JXA63_03340 [Candidatus Woesebacteria bacterium]|nr:hypothetical protein [Candidatus Woesebacteria bacterium]